MRNALKKVDCWCPAPRRGRPALVDNVVTGPIFICRTHVGSGPVGLDFSGRMQLGPWRELFLKL